MELAASDILTFLLIVAAVLLIAILYHVLFIVVDVRKMAKRANDVSAQLEDLIMKPLELVEESMTWLTEFLLSMYKDEKKDHKKHH